MTTISLIPDGRKAEITETAFPGTLRREKLKHFLEDETMELLEKLKQFNEASPYDSSDIAEKLISLTNLEDDGRLREELTNALYYIESAAYNPRNKEYFRVLYNVLLMVVEMDV